jgi:hypothetical protein
MTFTAKLLQIFWTIEEFVNFISIGDVSDLAALQEMIPVPVTSKLYVCRLSTAGIAG